MSSTKVASEVATSAKREEKKSRPAFKKSEYVPKKSTGEHAPRRNNVLIVRQNTRFKTLVILAKNLLKTQFDSIELHGVDDQSYLTVSLVAQCLMKYKYVEMSRLKTKTVQATKDDEDARVVLQPRLVIHLRKSKDFDSIYDEFESVYNKAAEEHKDETELGEAEAEAEIEKGEE